MSDLPKLCPNLAEPARTIAMDCRMSAMPTGSPRRRETAPSTAANQIVESGLPDSPRANPQPRTRISRIRFRFVLVAARSAVDGRRFACGWASGAVAPVPQITSLHARDLLLGQGLP